jgi:serine/threonine protein kinase
VSSSQELSGERSDGKQLVSEFDRAWMGSSVPRIEDFLTRARTSKPPAQPGFLEELVKVDLEYRWREPSKIAAGKGWSKARPRLEDYVAVYPDLGSSNRLPVHLIAEEYWVRHRYGDRPDHGEYLTRFPQQSAQLREALSRVDEELTAEAACEKGATIRERLQTDKVSAPAAQAPKSQDMVDLFDVLGHLQILSPAQMAEISRDSTSHSSDTRTLARTLLQRGWLTPYQVNQLVQGRGPQLVVGAYLLVERLGEGGAGQVFKARHQKMNRVAAVKIIRKELLADADVLSRFYREIQVLSQLNHPNVVHAYDAGPAGATHFLAMEYVEGSDLGRLVKKDGPMPVLQACEYIRQAAVGLQHAHERGLVHRDIKPHNLIMSVRDGLIKVADLGLARLPRTTNDEVTAALTGGVQTSGTLTPQNAVLMGTADYLAPEQAVDFHAADIRADIYSLGCTLYYLLTGRPPFPATTLVEKVLRHQQAEPPDLKNLRSDVPDGLVAIARRTLAKRPADRYQTPGELADALAPWCGASGTSTSTVVRSFKNRFRLSRRMTIGILLLIACLGSSVLIWRWASRQPGGTVAGLGLKLRDLDDNTWLKLRPPDQDKFGLGAPWCYDRDQRRFVRIGGTDVLNDRATASNAVRSLELSTLTWTTNLPITTRTENTKGLGYGGGRGTCYDRDAHSIWDYSDVGLFKGVRDLGPDKWKYIKTVEARVMPRLAYDEGARKLICLGYHFDDRLYTHIYDPAIDKMTYGGGLDSARGDWHKDYPPAFIYVPELKGCLLIRGKPEKLVTGDVFDVTAKAWRKLDFKGLAPPARSAMGLCYDRQNRVVLLFGGIAGTEKNPQVLNDLWIYYPDRNVWYETKSDSAPRYTGKYNPNLPPDCQMLAYDEEYKVHVLILQDWGTDSGIWAYRYKR